MPDGSAESTAEWPRSHLGTEIVSRDCASLYAQVATTAAPKAVKVADRWHLLHNLTEAFIGALVQHHRLLSDTARVPSITLETPSTPPPTDADKPIPRNEARRRQNREHRLAEYEAVIERVRKGVSQREVASDCGVGIRTIRRFPQSVTSLGELPYNTVVKAMSIVTALRISTNCRLDKFCLRFAA